MIRQEIIDLFHVSPATEVRLQDDDTGWVQTKRMSKMASASGTASWCGIIRLRCQSTLYGELGMDVCPI